MAKKWIKNFEELATNENRKLALDIIQAGFSAIDTKEVINNFIKLENDVLSIQGKNFDLSKFDKIKVVGFGKASVDAAIALEKIFGTKIHVGSVIGLAKADLKYIETFAGTHPRPSKVNVVAGERIYEIIKNSSEKDLIIVLVSGGGSALLCHSLSECDQNATLYDNFLKSGKTISEINTVRKHLSVFKGGGLAKVAYPATVVGLIFSDIPGDHFEDVASGSTYKDKSTINDAKKIIDEFNLGEFDLLETTKDDKYFEKVHNFVLVSNKIAVEAMQKKARELGLETKIASTELYDVINTALEKIFNAKDANTVVLAAGEPKIKVEKSGGAGGRNLHMGLQAIKMGLIDPDSVFISFASDGMDNSDLAGAVVDKDTLEKINKLGLDVDDYLQRFDSYSFFKQTNDLITTGPTNANVSDLMVLLTKK